MAVCVCVCVCVCMHNKIKRNVYIKLYISINDNLSYKYYKRYATNDSYNKINER